MAQNPPSPGQDYPTDDSTAAWDTLQRAKMSEYRGPHRPRPRFAATVEEFPLHIPPGKELGRTLGVAVAPNGDVYVLQWSDRGIYIPLKKEVRLPDVNRVQEFELVPGGVRYRREVYVAPGSIGMGSASDVAFTPDNRFMFVSDMMGMRIWTVDRKTFDVLGWTNAAPEHEGDDNISVNKSPIHRMALLPNGDLLLGRTRRGVQRLRFLGVS